MFRLIQFLAVLFIFASHLNAGELKPASYFSNEMVIQRDMPIKVWGTAETGAKVTVAFNGKQASAVTEENGKWLTTLPAMPLNTKGQDLVISSEKGDQKIIKNVVLGDVWLCSGQSNMGGPIKMDPSGEKAKKEANDQLLRMMNVNVDFYPYPLDDFLRPDKWGIAIGKHLDWKSAVSFFFGQALRRQADVPVGLVVAARGGTAIEAFLPYTSHKYLEEAKDNRHIKSLLPQIKATDLNTDDGKKLFEQYLADWKKWHEESAGRIKNTQALPPLPAFGHGNAGNLFNNMIHPLKNVGFKGMIWYQGESNGSQQIEYYYLLKAYIQSLRVFFNDPKMPFYIVQLAPYGKIDPQPGLGTGTSGIREAQRLVAMELPNTGLAVTMDIGNPQDIHPRNKKDVGERLALWALKNEYGEKDIVVSGPLYKKYQVDGNKIIVEFDHVGSGLMVGKKDGQKPATEDKGARLQQFAIAGKDLKFYPAEAVINGNTVIVSSDKVATPFAVRYAYSASPVSCNLYNKEGLPASPFKTDPW